jgi:hypothetical protein
MIPGWSLADDVGCFFIEWASKNKIIEPEKKIVDDTLRISGKRLLEHRPKTVEIHFWLVFLIKENQLLLKSIELFGYGDLDLISQSYFFELIKCKVPVQIKKGVRYCSIKSELEFLQLLKNYDLLARELEYTPIFT